MVLASSRFRFPLLRIVTAGAISAAALSACHKAPPPPPAAMTSAKPAAAVAPAQSLPQRQPGLWSVTVSMDGSADVPQAQQICMDALTDRHMGVLGNDLSGDHCKKTVSRAADGGWGLIAECDMGTGGVIEYSGQISGDFTQDYTEKVRAQTTGAALPQMDSVTNYTVLAKRQGDCAANQQPGDIISDGVRMNLFDMAGIPRAKPAQIKPSQASTSAPSGD